MTIADPSSLLQALSADLRGFDMEGALVRLAGQRAILAKLLQSFIDSGLWDEIRIITNQELEIPAGLHSPLLKKGPPSKTESYFSDTIQYHLNR